MSPHADNRLLTYLAWWNVALHLLALVFAAFGMHPGTPAVDLAQRQAYLAASPLGWTLGWGCWGLCAVSQVAFYGEMLRHLPVGGPLPLLAVTIATAGAAIDVSCDTIWITVVPQLAGQGEQARVVFLAFERMALAIGLVVPNTAYVVAVLILTLCLRGRPGLAPFTLAAGYGTFVFGILLSAAGFTPFQDNPFWVNVFAALTGPTILFYCVWVVLVARSFGHPACRPSVLGEKQP
jgi:hypothetical protein